MERFKWFEGVKLGHDPLQDRTLNEIYMDWIEKYGADFRKYWEERNRDKQKQCECPERASTTSDLICNERNKHTALFERFRFLVKIGFPFTSHKAKIQT